jgi:hypothetical protein
MFNQKPKKNTMLSFLAGSLFVSLYAVTMITAIQVSMPYNNVDVKHLSNTVVVYAQMNSKQGSPTTLIGDVNIPYSNSNDTKTTVVNNATNSKISTSIDKTAIALNVTSAVNFAKETPTTPISPTGISTQGLYQPLGHKVLNNNASMINK